MAKYFASFDDENSYPYNEYGEYDDYYQEFDHDRHSMHDIDQDGFQRPYHTEFAHMTQPLTETQKQAPFQSQDKLAGFHTEAVDTSLKAQTPYRIYRRTVAPKVKMVRPNLTSKERQTIIREMWKHLSSKEKWETEKAKFKAKTLELKSEFVAHMKTLDPTGKDTDILKEFELIKEEDSEDEEDKEESSEEGTVH
ncbi:unnamed protein product [Moneuplotes crassus]|uniref:HMG box domain-containing protein n=1 Tax=Euplotes crassus TaxID=5936 RepID=A0AAD1XVN6_EUPCR|nr:unnamed protein product [Moneuplotes crassus]